MLSIVSILSKLFVFSFLVFVFGYFESHSTTGVIVTISITSYLTLFRTSSGTFTTFASVILLVSEVVGRIIELKMVCFGSFLALDLLLLWELMYTKESNDLMVKLKPYEKEIRAILFEKDPSVLHRVDLWLEKHEGHERELLEKVKARYLRRPEPEEESESESEYEEEEEEEEEPPRVQGRQAVGSLSAAAKSPAAIRPQANPNFYYTPQQNEILSLIQQYDPSMLPGAHRLLADYRGRENELLHQLRTEFGLILDPPSASRGMPTPPSHQGAYRYGSGSSSINRGGVQLSNAYSASDGMRDYYGAAASPQFGQTSPLSGPFSSPSNAYYNRAAEGVVHRNKHY